MSEEPNAEMLKDVLDLLADGSDEVTLSSGVTVVVRPFPAGAWPRVQAKAVALHPEPEVPKKTVKVVDGTEEVDDTGDPEYQRARTAAIMAREAFLGEFILEFCVFPKDGAEMERQVERLGKFADLPDDPDDRRVLYLNEIAVRTQGDRESLSTACMAQVFVGSKEVMERVKFFRRQMEGAAAGGADAPGTPEIGALDAQPEGD